MPKTYDSLLEQIDGLLTGQDYWVADLANAAACLYHGLRDLNWIGFYIRRGDELWLGPFQGRPACTVIPFGKGVCGTAARARRPIVVPDVNEFPGHIVCDPASRSELVVPIVRGDNVLAVIDADSPLLNRFTDADLNGMCKIAEVLADRVKWDIL